MTEMIDDKNIKMMTGSDGNGKTNAKNEKKIFLKQQQQRNKNNDCDDG